MADVFRALDDATRRTLLDDLAARDAQTLFELCTSLLVRHGVTISRQGVSQHLAVLEEAGLVRTERRGRTKLHYFDPAPLAEIAARWPPRERTDP